jgi:UrcA family protein
MITMTLSTALRGLVTTAIVSALASSFAAVCAAADSSDPINVIVKYGDLNVSNPQGAATLYRRVVAAADSVCGSYAIDSRDLGSRARVNACVQKAIADAVTKVGQPELLAIYNAKNRQPLPIAVAAAPTR